MIKSGLVLTLNTNIYILNIFLCYHVCVRLCYHVKFFVTHCTSLCVISLNFCVIYCFLKSLHVLFLLFNYESCLDVSFFLLENSFLNRLFNQSRQTLRQFFQIQTWALRLLQNQIIWSNCILTFNLILNWLLNLNTIRRQRWHLIHRTQMSHVSHQITELLRDFRSIFSLLHPKSLLINHHLTLRVCSRLHIVNTCTNRSLVHIR